MNNMENMSNLENTVNNLLPSITKVAISFGLILCLLGITIAVYMYYRKKYSLKKIKVYLFCTSGSGALVSIIGLLINSIARFDIDFSSYKYSIPVEYAIALVAFFLLMNIFKKK